MSLMPIRGYSPNRQDYIDDPDTFNFRMPAFRPTQPRPMMSSMDRDIFGRSSIEGGKINLDFDRMKPRITREDIERQRGRGFGDGPARDMIRIGVPGRDFIPSQPAPPQFGRVQEQPQFNQQGMQQMMQMMQQMMQMFSQFSNQGGFGGGFGGGYGGGMGGGFGRGYGSMGEPFGQMMMPRPRPMPRPSYFRPSYFSQSPFGRY